MLTIADPVRITAPFLRGPHREFVLLSVLLALAAAKFGEHPRWRGWQAQLAASSGSG